MFPKSTRPARAHLGLLFCALLASNGACQQAGPKSREPRSAEGSSKSARLPDGVALHLDAAQIDADDGSPIVHWTDTSGNGRDAVSAAEHSPSFDPDGIHGRPALYFDGGDYLTITGASDEVDGATLAFVVSAGSAQPTSVVWSDAMLQDAAQHRAASVTRAGDGVRFTQRDPSGTQSLTAFSGPAGTMDAPRVIALRLPRGTRAPELWVDGWRQYSTRQSHAVRLGGSLGAVVSSDGTPQLGGSALQGHLAEVVMYDRALSDEDFAQLRASLRQKYLSQGVSGAPQIVEEAETWLRAEDCDVDSDGMTCVRPSTASIMSVQTNPQLVPERTDDTPSGRAALRHGRDGTAHARTYLRSMKSLSEYTLFTVAQRASDSRPTELWRSQGGVDDLRLSMTADGVHARHRPAAAADFAVLSSPPTGDRPFVSTVSASEDGLELFLNGALHPDALQRAAVAGTLDLDIVPADGVIYEVLGFRRLLDDEERAQVQRYLARRYLTPSTAASVPGGAALHLSAAQMSLQDGDPVAQWQDLNDPTRHAVSSLGVEHTPSYRARAVGGQPALYFDGDDYLALPGPEAPVDGATIAFVFRPNEGSAHQAVWDSRPATGAAQERTALWHISTGIRFGQHREGNAGWSIFAGTTQDIQRGLVVAVRTPAGGGVPDLWVDGYRQYTSREALPMWFGGNLGAESGTDGAPLWAGRGLQGHVAEVVMYDRALTDSEFASLRGALRTRYQADDFMPGAPTALATASSWLRPAECTYPDGQLRCTWPGTRALVALQTNPLFAAPRSLRSLSGRAAFTFQRDAAAYPRLGLRGTEVADRYSVVIAAQPSTRSASGTLWRARPSIAQDSDVSASLSISGASLNARLQGTTSAGDVADVRLTGQGVDDAQPFVATLTGSPQGAQLYLNGQLADQTDVGVPGSQTLDFAPSAQFDGLIYDVIVFDHVLTDSDRQAVEDYLLGRYSTPCDEAVCEPGANHERNGKLETIAAESETPGGDGLRWWRAFALQCTLGRILNGAALTPQEQQVAEAVDIQDAEVRATLLKLRDELADIDPAVRAQLLGPFAPYDPIPCDGEPDYDDVASVSQALCMADMAPARAPHCTIDRTAITVAAEEVVTPQPTDMDDYRLGSGLLGSTARPMILGVHPEGQQEVTDHALARDWAANRTGVGVGDGFSPWGVPTTIPCGGETWNTDICEHELGLICGDLMGKIATSESPTQHFCHAYPVVHRDERLTLLGYNFWDPTPVVKFSPVEPGATGGGDVRGTASRDSMSDVECQGPQPGAWQVGAPWVPRLADVGNHDEVEVGLPDVTRAQAFEVRMYNENGTYSTGPDCAVRDVLVRRTVHVCHANIPEEELPYYSNSVSAGARDCVVPTNSCTAVENNPPNEDGTGPGVCAASTWGTPPRAVDDPTCFHNPGEPPPCAETPYYFESVFQRRSGMERHPVVVVLPSRPLVTRRAFLNRVEALEESGRDRVGKDELELVFVTQGIPFGNVAEVGNEARQHSSAGGWNGNFNEDDIKRPEHTLVTVPEVPFGADMYSALVLLENDRKEKNVWGGVLTAIGNVGSAVGSAYGESAYGGVPGALVSVAGMAILLSAKDVDVLGVASSHANAWREVNMIAQSQADGFLASSFFNPLAGPPPIDNAESFGFLQTTVLHPIVEHPRHARELDAQCGRYTTGSCEAANQCYVNRCIEDEERYMSFPDGFQGPQDDPLRGIGYRVRYDLNSTGEDVSGKRKAHYTADLEFVICAEGSDSPRCTAE